MQRSLSISELVTADKSDLLNDTILQSIPRTGTLVVEASSNICASGNEAKLTIQEPDGHVPINKMTIPAGTGHLWVDTGNNPILVLDDRTERMWTFRATEGGHFSISIDVSGDAAMFVFVTLLWDDEG